jgi:hypothetical protein
MIRRLVTLSCAAVLIACGGAALSQQTASTAKTALSPTPRTYLETDPQLAQTLTLNVSGQTYAQICERIRRKTGVRLTFSEGANEFRDQAVVIYGENVPARAVMDALAAIYLCRWERVSEKQYNLLDVDHLARSRPDQELRDAVIAAGIGIRDAIQALPPAERERLTSGKYVSFASLSPAVQAATRQFFEASNRQSAAAPSAAAPRPTPIPIEALANSQLTFSSEAHQDHTSYNVHFQIPVDSNGSSIGGTSSFDDRGERRQREIQRRAASGEVDELYIPRRYEVSAEEARRRPELQRTVELTMRNATYNEAFARLCRQAGAPFVHILNEPQPVRRDVSLPRMPLAEALNRLTADFNTSEWEYRRPGFLVVRGPGNGARSHM